MRWMPRIRILLARRPLLYWLVVCAVALAVAMAVHGAVARAEQQRNSWGVVVSVVVAQRQVAPGESLTGAVSTRKIPQALVPVTAVRSLPGQALARQRIAAGEVLVGLDIAPDSGPLTLLPLGWLAIGIDETNADRFHIGDSAALLAGGAIIAPAAVVVQVLDGSVVVGVPSAAAGAVADAANQHLVTIALSANPSQQ